MPLVALGYDTWRARSLTLIAGRPFGLDAEARLFEGVARPAPGEWWFDAGTSTGFYAELAARAGARVVAADFSPAMLARARSARPHPNIHWALLDIEGDTGLPGASFDGITVGATLGELARPEAALDEFQRLLRPGGRLWIMYVRRTGGPLQAALSALGGTSFPDRADIHAALPACTLHSAYGIGEVTFELFVRKQNVFGEALP